MIHYDNGTYFCEDQERRRRRGLVTGVAEDVECPACLQRLARIALLYGLVAPTERAPAGAAGRIDWFGES